MLFLFLERKKQKNANEKKKYIQINQKKKKTNTNQILFVQFPILFADADFCCGMDTPEKAKNVSGWLPGRAQNRGAFQFPNFTKKKKQISNND